MTTAAFNTKVKKGENKIPDTNIVTKAALNTKATEVQIENKTLDCKFYYYSWI